MGRIEYKYLIDNDRLSEFRALVHPYLHLDPYAATMPQHAYTVRSLYFDTPGLESYHEKLAGIARRRKIRIRGYNGQKPDTAIFFEIKRKIGPTIRKARYKTNFSEMRTCFAGNQPRAGNMNQHSADLSAFFYQVITNRLGPVIQINYEREAYFYRYNPELRITFDMQIRSELADDPLGLFREKNQKITFPGKSIIEIKTRNVFPHWLKVAIHQLELRSEALSKYTYCLDVQRHKSFLLENSLRHQKPYWPHLLHG